MNSIQVNPKGLMRFHSGCHGNLVAVEMKQVAFACCPKKLSWQLITQYDLTLPDLSFLLPTTLSNGGGEGSSVDPLLTHEPFALTASNLIGC